MDKEKILEFYKSHHGGINGALMGLVLAIFFLVVGFFKTVFIALCVGIGYYIGSKITEDRDYIRNLLDRILPPGTYRWFVNYMAIKNY